MNQKIAIWNIVKVVVPTATATFATSNQTLSVSQTSKVEDTEEESTNGKESISGNHIIDVGKYTFSGIFEEMFYPKCLSAVH